nr:P57 beta SGP=S-locus specific glycoprotein [Brassica oleracea L., var. acephala, Peptide Partial, 15 aa] [Brassica oleracea]
IYVNTLSSSESLTIS